jgi:hypothetical protein
LPIVPPVNGAAAAALREAGFQAGVAYMVVPRCDACRWWRADGIGDHNVRIGDCLLFTLTRRQREHERAKLEITAANGEGVCATDADFGCVQFEGKGA